MLKSIANTFFKKIIEKEKLAAVEEALRVRRIQEALQRAADRNAEYKYLLGKPVIVITNEWKDPLIGTMTRLEIIPGLIESAHPVVFDELTQQEYMTFGSVCHYSVALVRALEKLTPSESWQLVTKGRCGEVKQPEYVTNGQYRCLLARLPSDLQNYEEN